MKIDKGIFLINSQIETYKFGFSAFFSNTSILIYFYYTQDKSLFETLDAKYFLSFFDFFNLFSLIFR